MRTQVPVGPGSGAGHGGSQVHRTASSQHRAPGCLLPRSCLGRGLWRERTSYGGELNCVAPNSCVEVLANFWDLGTRPYWEIGWLPTELVRMMSCWRRLCPYQKGKFGHRHEQGEMRWTQRQEWTDAPTSWGASAVVSRLPGAEGLQKDQPADPRILGFLSRTGREQFSAASSCLVCAPSSRWPQDSPALVLALVLCALLWAPGSRGERGAFRPRRP